MVSTTFPLFLVAFGGAASAQIMARHVTQNLLERAIRPAGGLGLTLQAEKFCPNDMLSCNSGSYCCPTSMTCSAYAGDSGTCCPGTQDCSIALRVAPYCADDTWSLWDRSQGGINTNGYFCCAVGMIGLLDGTCLDPIELSSPTLEALAMAPGGAVLSTTAAATSTLIAVSLTGTTTASTATTGVVIVPSSNVTVTMSKSSTAKSSGTSASPSSVTSLTSVSSVVVSTSAITSSSAATTSATKSSGANTISKIFGFGSMPLVQAALAMLVGVGL